MEKLLMSGLREREREKEKERWFPEQYPVDLG